MPEGLFHRIVIRFPNWLGDAVMATPVLQQIKSHWPKASITAICQGGVGQLLQGNPFLNTILACSRNERKKNVNVLKQERFDLGILLTNSFSSAWQLWRAGVQRRVGYVSDWRRFFLTDPIPFPSERGQEHLVLTYQRLLTSWGFPAKDYSPELFVSPDELRNARLRLKALGIQEGTTLIGINPGAAYGSAKCWLPDRFRAVIEHLLMTDKRAILLFGDKTTASLVDTICQGLSPRVVNLAGKTTLRELMASIACCNAFLTNDSGPMHIAAALKTPLVALFGSTNEIATGPYRTGTVIHKHVECSPCYRRTCPIDFRCMTRIHVDEVSEAIERLLF